jgi:transcriptional regulator with XRE-family HTH domain
MNLRDLRKHRKLTGKDVHAETGITPGRLSDFERGRRAPSLDQLLALLDLYGQAKAAAAIRNASRPATLKAMRRKAGLSQYDAGGELEDIATQAAMSRIESGQQAPLVSQLADMWDLYGYEHQAAFLRGLVDPSTSHGSRKTKAEKDATRDAWKARRKGGSGGAHDVGHLAGVEPKPVVIRTPDGREFGRAKRALEAVAQAVRPQVVPALA